MRLTLPNLLSVLRMGLVPVFIIALLHGRSPQALAVMVVAGITDALDGYLARSLQQQSLLGSYLDPIADKLLLTSAYVVLAIPGIHPGLSIPVWVTVLVLARDVLILGIALVLYLTIGMRRFPPTLTSKATTVMQVTAVLAVLASGIWLTLEPVAAVAMFLVAGLTVLSGVQYGWRVLKLDEDPMPAGDDPDRELP